MDKWNKKSKFLSVIIFFFLKEKKQGRGTGWTESRSSLGDVWDARGRVSALLRVVSTHVGDCQLMAPLVQELGRDRLQIAARVTVVMDTFL